MGVVYKVDFKGFLKKRWVRCVREQFIAFLVITLITSFYEFIILFYTHGALLIGGDNPGYYTVISSWGQLNPSSALNSLSLIISNGNYYHSFYIDLFIKMDILLWAIYRLVIEFFKPHVKTKHLVYIGFLAAFLFPINLSAIQAVWQSFIGQFSLFSGLFILFLSLVVRIWSKMLNGERPKVHEVIISFLLLGLSGSFYPNVVRIIILGWLVFIYFFVIAFLASPKKKISIKGVGTWIFFIFLAAIFSFLGGVYSLLGIVISSNTVSSSVKLSAIFSSSLVQPGGFNTFFNTIRIIQTQFFSESPYYLSYLQNPIIVMLSYIWPILALAVAYHYSMKDNIKRMYPIFILIIAMILWETGANPPIGTLYILLVNASPLIVQIFPPGFLMGHFIVPFYVVFASYSIYRLYIDVRDKVYSSRSVDKRTSLNRRFRTVKTHLSKARMIIPVLVLVVFLSAIIVSAYPIFNGQAEGEFFNNSAKGTFIPNEYPEVKNIISQSLGNMLILPGMNTYIQTSWDYQGTSFFYNAYFANDPVFTMGSFGDYSSFNGSFMSLYTNMTSPLSYSSLVSPIAIDYNYSSSFVWGANSTVSHHNLLINSSKSKTIDFFFASNLVNVSAYPYLQLSMSVKPADFFTEAVNHGGVSVGISSPGVIGWFYLNAMNTHRENNSSNFTITLPMSPPDYGQYTPSHIGNFNVQMPGGPALNVSFPTLGGLNYSLSSNWINLVQKYNIKYLLLDKSLVSGTIETYNYTNRSLLLLQADHIVSSIYSSGYLKLFTVNQKTVSSFS